MPNATKLSYCAQIVRDNSPDRFLLTLFIPLAQREALLALYALDVELAHVHRAVSEEALGHIRYAWWQESLEAVIAGQKPREHPVITAFPPQALKDGVALIAAWRSRYPDLPPDSEQLLDDASLGLIRALCPQAETGWCKAKAMIVRHRQRFGRGWNSWLHLKLMVAGLF